MFKSSGMLSSYQKAMQLLIEHGADVNAQDRRCSMPLHLALSLGDADSEQLLIRHGARVNAQDGSRSTPLHLASSKSNAKIVQLLIERGADVNARDESHRTPLHLALSSGNTENFQLLMLKYCVWCALTHATPQSRAQTSSHVRVGTPWWRVGRRGEMRG